MSKVLYLKSLSVLGINYKEHDIRFVEDDWESPTLRSLRTWMGSIECDGMEMYSVYLLSADGRYSNVNQYQQKLLMVLKGLQCSFKE